MTPSVTAPSNTNPIDATGSKCMAGADLEGDIREFEKTTAESKLYN